MSGVLLSRIRHTCEQKALSDESVTNERETCQREGKLILTLLMTGRNWTMDRDPAGNVVYRCKKIATRRNTMIKRSTDSLYDKNAQ